jgi:hypothetical protein
VLRVAAGRWLRAAVFARAALLSSWPRPHLPVHNWDVRPRRRLEPMHCFPSSGRFREQFPSVVLDSQATLEPAQEFVAGQMVAGMRARPLRISFCRRSKPYARRPDAAVESIERLSR